MIIETCQTISLYATLREMRIDSKRLGGSSTQLGRLVVELIFCEFSLSVWSKAKVLRNIIQTRPFRSAIHQVIF